MQEVQSGNSQLPEEEQASPNEHWDTQVPVGAPNPSKSLNSFAGHYCDNFMMNDKSIWSGLLGLFNNKVYRVSFCYYL